MRAAASGRSIRTILHDFIRFRAVASFKIRQRPEYESRRQTPEVDSIPRSDSRNDSVDRFLGMDRRRALAYPGRASWPNLHSGNHVMMRIRPIAILSIVLCSCSSCAELQQNSPQGRSSIEVWLFQRSDLCALGPVQRLGSHPRRSLKQPEQIAFYH